MASIAKLNSQDIGDGEILKADITFAASYPAGGEQITAREFGLRVGSRLDRVTVNPVGGRTFVWVPDPLLPFRGKLKVLDTKGADDFVLNRPGLTIGTVSAKQVKLANPITSVVAGAILELAAAEHAFTATTHDITAHATLIQEAIFLLSDDGAGTLTITKGTTAGEDLAVPPSPPAGEAVAGYVKIQVAPGTTPADDFDATTDDLDAAWLTTTFEDLDNEALEATDLSGLTARAVVEGR